MAEAKTVCPLCGTSSAVQRCYKVLKSFDAGIPAHAGQWAGSTSEVRHYLAGTVIPGGSVSETDAATLVSNGTLVAV
jgi:hypothetical protein